jgi:iron complex outermembrane recepter protein
MIRQVIFRTLKGRGFMSTIGKLLSTLLAGVALQAQPVWAQGKGAADPAQAASSDAANNQQMVLDEIVVTAQKRAESLQTVPLSVSAFTGNALESQAISSLGDLASRVPSLIYDERSGGQPRYYIRGIGNNLESGAVDEDVGVFIDGVYLARPEMTNNEFLDIERIEVLRGPQGTLFGRNVVGGAISFFTRRPSNELVASASATVGNYNQFDVRAYVSGPLTDTLSGKVAATATNRDGYFTNTTTGNDIEDEQFTGFRAALRWQPTTNLDILLQGDTSRRRGTGSWVYITFTGPVFQGLPDENPYRGPRLADEGTANVDNDGVNLNIDWESDVGTLTSITAYRRSKGDTGFAATGYPVRPLGDPDLANGSNVLIYQQYVTDTNQFSQELRLASPAERRFSWLLGLYYFNTDVFYDNQNLYQFNDFGPDGVRGTFSGTSDTKANAYAAFANAKFNITERLSLQGGLRYSRDSKSTTITTGGTPFFSTTDDPANPFTVNGVPVPNYTVSARKSWDAWTPAASLNWQATKDHFLYATVSRGFKSGGFQNGSRNIEAAAAQIPFNPEFAWNYEIGLKSEWFDRTLRFNLSAFHIDYTDLQLIVVSSVLPPPSFPQEFIANAGQAVSEGIEAEINWIPAKGLSLFGSYSYTKTKLKNTIIDTDSGPVDLSGNELGKAPRHNLFLGASYTFPVSSRFDLTVRGDYSYNSKYFSSVFNNPLEIVPSKQRINAGATLETNDGRWAVDLWVKNLTDSFDFTEQIDVFGTSWALPILPPRTFGATLRFKY